MRTKTTHEKLVPLYMIAKGGKYRLPGKRRVFTKLNNDQAITFQDYTPEGVAVVGRKEACACKNSSGKTFFKYWWDWVVEVE